MRKLQTITVIVSVIFALGVGGAALAAGGHGNGPPDGCPIQSPQGSIAAAAMNEVGPPCGFAVGLLGKCPPHSQNGGNPGPPCGKSTTTTTAAAPAPCGFSNPPTKGPISNAVGMVGEAIGNNALGVAVVSIACAISSLTGGAL